ncbi:MAG: response regulator, partial [Elusimicrobia bacterium]|nr:response regulator [Elusimicrobiota bacterium]
MSYLPHPPMEVTLDGRPVDANATQAKAPPRRAHTVLIVDDNADYRGIVALVLNEEGFIAIEACDGREGLNIAVRRRPDLVLLDYNMPRMNGYEFLQGLRSVDEIRRTPVIFFTGASNRRHLRELNLDVVEFLDKPVSNQSLLELVRRCLGVDAKPEA